MADESEDRREVTDDELDVAFAGAAPGANRFILTLGPTGVRIAFLEENSKGRVYFRNAITLHPQDGIKLYKLLQGMLKDIEGQIERIQAEQAEAAAQEKSDAGA